MAGCLMSCQPLPESQIESAQSALALAKRVEVEKYAPGEFTQLQDSLRAALAEVSRQKVRALLVRDYAAARKTLKWVDEFAPRAMEKARLHKAGLYKTTAALVQTARAAVDSAAVLGARASGRKALSAELTQELNQLKEGLDEAGALLRLEHFVQAQERARQVQTGAAQLQNEARALMERAKEPMAQKRVGEGRG
jgi:hypothetical protein